LSQCLEYTAWRLHFCDFLLSVAFGGVDCVIHSIRRPGVTLVFISIVTCSKFDLLFWPIWIYLLPLFGFDRNIWAYVLFRWSIRFALGNLGCYLLCLISKYSADCLIIPQWRFRTSLLPLLRPQSALLSSCDMTLLVGNSPPLNILHYLPPPVVNLIFRPRNLLCSLHHSQNSQHENLPEHDRYLTDFFLHMIRSFGWWFYDLPTTGICFLTSDHLNSDFCFFLTFSFHHTTYQTYI